ncbi:MAG: hypothetical protein KY445_08215 [Armatimonadetes bacterium]|nr:hypothetical protein [Armatimonadota bacterium]
MGPFQLTLRESKVPKPRSPMESGTCRLHRAIEKIMWRGCVVIVIVANVTLLALFGVALMNR